MPDWTHDIRTFLADLKLDPARESEIVEELAQHANDRYDELIAAGSVPDQARRSVLDELNASDLAAKLRLLSAHPARNSRSKSLPVCLQASGGTFVTALVCSTSTPASPPW